MQRIALLAAALALAACSARSPWAGGSAKAPVATPESAPLPVAAPAPEAAATEPQPGAPVAGTGAKYSWQVAKKEAAAEAVAKPATGAPADETKARILALRPEHGLIGFIRKEKPDDGAFLQLTKNDKALLVRVIRSDADMTTADIIAGQDPAKTPLLEVGDEVACGTPSDLPPQ